MRVALVLCPNPLLESPDAHIQQGVLYVADSLIKAGHEVGLVDLRSVKKVSKYYIPKTDVVAVTATSGEYAWAKKIAHIAREKGAQTMIGGPHATFMTNACLKDFDYVIKGDGELAVLEALRIRVPGIYETPLFSLADYFPNRELAGWQGFSRKLFPGAGYGEGFWAAGIISNRGCGFHCAYCRSKRDKIRLRPIEDVIIELEGIIKTYGIRHFRFYDENFTNPKPRALELYKALEPLKIKMRCHTRSDAWDNELAEAAKKAGVEEMGFGFETASDSVLGKIRKQETVEQHRQAVRVCKKVGIACKAFWMTSLPGETWASIEAIKRFMLEEKPEKFIVSNFAAYPGSDIWEHPEHYGVKWLEQDLGKYWNFSDEPLIEYEGVSRKELKQHYLQLKNWLAKEFPR